MFDPYAKITELDSTTQLKLCNSLELRAADPEMKEIIQDYISGIRTSPGMEILEVGCGTGAIARKLVEINGVKKVVGIDPSSIFIEQAQVLNPHPNIEYVVGDGNELPFENQSFDVVVFHTVLCHVPSPQKMLEEGTRVLKKGGQLVIFDGDYSLRSVAIGEDDPLQSSIEIMKKYNCLNLYITRQLPSILSNMGFSKIHTRSHGYLAKDPSYMLNFIERGIDRLAEFGVISQNTANNLKKEANERVKDGRFFGFIPFLSVIAEAE